MTLNKIKGVVNVTLKKKISHFAVLIDYPLNQATAAVHVFLILSFRSGFAHHSQLHNERLWLHCKTVNLNQVS